MAVHCSCRFITCQDIRQTVTTCLSGQPGPCLRKQVKRQLVQEKGAPNRECGGSCGPNVNNAVDKAVAEVSMEMA